MLKEYLKSHWPDGNLNADLDDLRFYNRPITLSEIIELLHLNTSSTPSTSLSTSTSLTSTKTTVFNFGELNVVQISSLLNSNYDLNGCIVNCSNNGQCKFDFLNNQYICSCFFSYLSGYACQIDTRPCSSNPCLNNATCVNYSISSNSNSSSFRCVCDKYHRGTYCESEIDMLKQWKLFWFE